MAAPGRYCCKSILGHGARNIDSSEAFKREGWFKALSVAERKLRRQSIQPTFATLSARSCPKERAELSPLCPSSSDVNLLGDSQGIVDLNAEIPHGALDLGVIQRSRVIMHLGLTH
jgi:hypothetical protein